MMGNGVLLLVFGVRATRAGFGATATSAIIASYYVGFLSGSLLAPVMVRRSSTGATFSGLCLLVAAAAIAPPLFVNPVFWLALRITIGFSFAAMYVAIESWLNRSTPNEDRARVLGIYVVVVMISFAAGSLIIPLFGTRGLAPFAVASALAVAGALMTIKLPEFGRPVVETERMALRSLLQRAPLGTASTALTGFANAAFISSLAVWATRNNYSEGRTALFATLGSAGPLALQIPLSRLSDRVVHRASVMFVVTLTAAGVAIGGALGPERGMAPMMGIFVLGGLTYTLYSINGAEANDRLGPSEMPSAGGFLMLLTGIGAIAGSITVGIVTRWIGNDAMFWVVAGAHVAIAFAVLALSPRPTVSWFSVAESRR